MVERLVDVKPKQARVCKGAEEITDHIDEAIGVNNHAKPYMEAPKRKTEQLMQPNKDGRCLVHKW